MKQRPTGRPSSEKIIRDIKRNTRKQYSAEEKIRIVLDGVRGEDSIAQLCRREGIAQSLYYKWSKDFMQAGKQRLAGDIVRQANTSQVTALRCLSSNKWDRCLVLLRECFAHHFHVTRRVVGSAIDVPRWSFV